MLNPSWGKVKTINASSILVPQNQGSLVPGGTVVPTFRLQTDRGQIITSTFRDNLSVALLTICNLASDIFSINTLLLYIKKPVRL